MHLHPQISHWPLSPTSRTLRQPVRFYLNLLVIYLVRVSSRNISVHSKPYDDLTLQEQEALRLLADGLTNREMADALSVSLNTVETHLRHIYQKLGVRHRIEAAKWYMDHVKRERNKEEGE